MTTSYTESFKKHVYDIADQIHNRKHGAHENHVPVVIQLRRDIHTTQIARDNRNQSKPGADMFTWMVSWIVLDEASKLYDFDTKSMSPLLACLIVRLAENFWIMCESVRYSDDSNDSNANLAKECAIMRDNKNVFLLNTNTLNSIDNLSELTPSDVLNMI